MSDTVSVIIPAYNVEKYVSRCLESLISQNYKNFEAIVIDDGSTDSTSCIIEEYSRKDPRIQFIRKENSGVSATRNLGLSLAKGKYLMFFDSDDFMNPNHISSLIEFLENEEDTDCAINGYSLYSQKNHKIIKNVEGSEGKFSGQELVERLILHSGDERLISGVNNKLYIAHIIQKYNLKLDESISYGEDWLFNIEYYNRCRFIRIHNLPTSNYVQYEEDRLSTRFNPNGLKIAIFIRNRIMSLFPNIISPAINSRQLLDLKDIFVAKYARSRGLRGFLSFCDSTIKDYDLDLIESINKSIDKTTLTKRDKSLLKGEHNKFAFYMIFHCLPYIAMSYIKRARHKII